MFRNKEGHIAVLWHKYDSNNYRAIENAIKKFYSDAFNEKIEFNISMESKDKGQFKKVR